MEESCSSPYENEKGQRQWGNRGKKVSESQKEQQWGEVEKQGGIRNTFENWVRDGWGHWQGYTTNLRVERGELSFRQFVGGTERLRMLIENI